jgi:transcription elongation factor Elf1
MSFSARSTCPSCGSSNVDVGSTDYEADNYESSTCQDCGASWGGANFWE